MFNEPNSYDGGGGGSGYGFSIDGGSKGYTDDKPSERKNKKVANVSLDGRSSIPTGDYSGNGRSSIPTCNYSGSGSTTVYRSVSNAEAQDIRNTGRFNLPPDGMECKQFGFSLSETRQFGEKIGQNTIVSARVPNSMLNQLYTVGVDTRIFRSGTLTVYEDKLFEFNQAVKGTIRFVP